MSEASRDERLSVLVAEDSPDNRLLQLYMFRRLGLEPDFCENGQEAVKATEKRDYDLIFLDIQMPVMCGLETVKHLRAKGIQTPIVALTAHAMVTFKKECLEAGFNSIITKPFRIEELAKIVANTENRIALS